MSDELKIPLNPFTDTGLTLLGKVYNSTGAQEGSTVSMSEDGPALYIGDFDVTTRNDGQYVVRFETNTPDKLYGTGSLYIRDGKEVSPEMYFNQALDTVANVTLVDTTTTNSDMRGTDGANTVTPDNAGIAANGNAIAALNDFDPSTDQVIVATNNDKTGYSISGTKNTLDDLNDVSASDVYAEFTTGSNEDVFKADVSNLDVAVSTRNAIAPDNAGITANGNAIAALNDIAATDIVSNGAITTLAGAVVNVDTVDTCTTNTDMRGTDGANTIAPDNAGITANGNAISALNNFDPASDQVIVATNNDKTNYSLTTADKDDIVDGVWDEPLTGATHNDPTSAGRRLRQANLLIAAESTVNGGTPTTTSFLTNLTHSDDDAYNDQTLVFTSGVNIGQAKIISDYDGATKRITVDESFTQIPSGSDEFVILADHTHTITQIQEGLGTIDNQNIINENVKKSSRFIPASENLPDS